MAELRPAYGKTYGEIWAELLAKHARNFTITFGEHDLRQIHIRWKRLAAECRTP